MRNLNFLRKSERKSVGTTLALTVGSPSAHRRYSALKHLAFMLLFLLGSLNVWGADESVTFSTQGYTNQQEISSYTGTDFSIAFNKGTNNNAPKYFTSGSAIRAYGGNYFTVSSTKTIAKIELTFGSSDGSNAITTNVATYSNGTWNGSATSVQFTIGGTTGNRRLAEVAVTFAGGCSSEVDITKGAESHGNYTLSAAKVCADGDGGEITISDITPAPGYEFDEITTSASGTVDNALKKVTGIKAATTITVKFKEKTKYTVTWNVNGDESLKTSVYDGEKPVFPATPAACDATSTTFVGWATAAWEGKATNLEDSKLSGITIYTSASAMPAVGAAVTYYAVFAKVSGESGWIETAIGNLGASDIFVIVGNNGNTYAMTNNNGTSNPPSAPAVTIADSKITSEVADNIKWNISGNATDGYTFYPNGNSESWLYCTNANNGVRVGTNDNKTFTIDGGYLYNSGTSRYVGIYNSQDWRCYTSNGGNIADQTFAFYKYSAGSASDYMTTCAACTHLVDAPELDGTIAVTPNTATINWKTLTNASSYDVTVIRNSDSESIFSGNVNALTKALTGLDPETQYDYSIMGVGDGSTYCTTGNGVLNGSFTTDALPTAVLTLMENGNEVAGGSHAITVPFALPTAVTHTCGKTFVGWTSKSDFEDGDEELASYYAKGAEFTFENTTGVTLYAVYADGGATEETATVSIASYATANSWENGTQHSSVTLDENVTATASSGTNTGKYYTTGNEWRFYQGESATITIATAVGELSSIKFTYNVDKTGILEDADNNEVESATAVSASGTSAVYHVANSGSATNGQVKFTAIEVKYLKPGSYSNYSTTCAAAPTAEANETDVAALVNVDAAGTNGTVAMTYTNVNLDGVVVALFNNETCTEPFDGGWLEAEIAGDDKHIAYTIDASDVYVARSAYIKLTAPETNGATDPAVVIIPVSQEAKALVFSSLEELVAANLASGTEVTVSFSNVMITEVYTTKAGYRYGLYLNVKDKGGVNDIELFYNKQENYEQVPDTWVKNGYVSATNLVTTWTEYKGQWELAMQGAEWNWENGDITYAAPKAVSSVVVSGEPTKTVYVDGEKFNPAGLTVTVNYTVGDPEVIAAADADWVYETSDVLALNQTSINVKATYNTVTSENFYEVTGLTVGEIPNKTIAQFIADEGGRCYLEGIVSGNINTTYGNFDLQDETGTIYVYGSDVFDGHGVDLGDKVKVIAEEYLLYKKAGNPDKDEALNVVFVSKVSAATIAIDDINMTVDDELLLSDIVATVTPDAAQSATINYEVTEGTAVTISEGKIIANTEGEATITASIAAGEGYLAGSTTFTVIVSPAPVPFEGDYFVKVANNSDLTAGEYLIVYEDGSLAFNGGLEALDAASNTVAVTFENGKIQGKAEVLEATFTIKLAGTIQSKSGYYIGRTGNSNGMNTSKDEAYTNAISIDGGGNAVILASGGAYLRYNSTSGQERFRYFQSSSYTGQKAIQLYKKENAEPVYETVRSGLEINRYYTVCLPKKVTAIKGASFWTLNNKSQDGATAYLEEETNNLPFAAGKPFIIQATAEKLEVVYEGAATEDAGTNGALHGTLVYMDAAALAAAGSDVYMLFSNELRPVGENNHLDANRAYVLLSELNAVAEAPQSAPGKRVRAMPMQPQVATGFEAAEANEAPRKVLINGEFFIIRGEKMYDAKGQLVK